MADRYEVLNVCAPVDSTALVEWSSTSVAEKASLRTSQCGDNSARVAATGKVSDEAQVWLGDTNTGLWGSDEWTFTVHVERGTHDLMVSNAYDDLRSPLRDRRIVIRRGIEIDGDGTEIANVDLEQEGELLDDFPVELTNAMPGEAFSTLVSWDPSEEPFDDVLVSDRVGNIASVIPTTLLQDDDVHVMSVSGSAANQLRTVYARVGDMPGAVALPPAIPSDAVTFSSNEVAWSGLTDVPYSHVEFFVQVPSGNALRRRVSSRWTDAETAGRLSLDVDVPGFDQAWRVDTTKRHFWSFRAYTADGEIGRITSVGALVDP